MGYFDGKKVGLVLSGGGAKGAYQTGMLTALEELGLKKEQLVLAGTSIGAINSFAYALRGKSAIREILDYCRKMIEGAIPYDPASMKSPGDISALLEPFRKLAPDSLCASNTIPITVCAYCAEHRRPEYFRLNGLPPEDQRKLVLASATLPELSHPIEYGGLHYSDGGVVPESLRADGAPADKIPVRAMAGTGVDVVLVSYLKPEDKADLSLAGTDNVIEIRPSRPLEKEKGTGTLDFSKESLRLREEMGYRETRELFLNLR